MTRLILIAFHVLPACESHDVSKDVAKLYHSGGWPMGACAARRRQSSVACVPRRPSPSCGCAFVLSRIQACLAATRSLRQKSCGTAAIVKSYGPVGSLAALKISKAQYEPLRPPQTRLRHFRAASAVSPVAVLKHICYKAVLFVWPRS